jgi:hypothetical protein
MSDRRAPLLHAHTGDHRDLLVALAQRRDLVAVHRGERRAGHVDVRDPGHVGLVRVDPQPHGEALRAPVVADAARALLRAQQLPDLAGQLPQRGNVLAGDAHRDRDPHSASGLELAHVERRARHSRAQRLLQRADQVLRVVLVLHLDQDLRVVGLLLLRRHRVPEAGPAAAHEGRDGLELVAGQLADDSLRLHGRAVGGGERRVLRQPDVHVEEVLEVLGEELLLELAREERSERQERERARDHAPAVLDRPGPDAVVAGGKSRLAPFLDRCLGLGPEQVVAEQRDERHRDEARRHQRAADHHGQAVHEVPGVAGQKQERQVGHDVGDGGVEDGGRELGGAEPGCHEWGMAVGQRALDRVARHHRVVHQQAEGDDQRGDRDLLQVDPQQVHEAEGHRKCDRDAERHQQRRAPLPEAHQRDEHDERHRLVEARHEEVHVLLDLERLVRGARQDQVLGQPLLEVR